MADTILDPESLRRRMREMLVLVAFADGRIVGTIGGAAHGTEGHLRGMAVLPEWQGTGVAPALLAAIEAGLQKRGCTAATLDTTEPLERAIRFYTRNGYSRTGAVSGFFGMQLYEYSKRLSAQ
ncbi:MAG TPA: GNAT family N-acetyltransferase [Terracidiphilus sp.]|nr:GNAT family N-acetyltransferase [Terracidiphilus sp.]